MNNDRIAGQWKQLHGRIQQKWGKLSNDDLDVVDGDTTYLVGKLQERYGIARDAAEAQVRTFSDEL